MSPVAKWATRGVIALGVIGLSYLAYRYFTDKKENPENGSNDNTNLKPVSDSTSMADTTGVINADIADELTTDTIMAAMVPAIDSALVQESDSLYMPCDYRFSSDSLPGPYNPDRPVTENALESTDNVEQSSENEVQKIKKENDRIAFENAVTKIREQISVVGIETEDYTIVKGDCFWNIAVKTLKQEEAVKLLKEEGVINPTKDQILKKAESVAKPENKEIVKRIALLAELNNVAVVTKEPLYTNHSLKVPAIV